MNAAASGRAGAREIAASVRAGEISSIAVTEAVLARIAERNPALNCFTSVTADRALAQACAVDAWRAGGGDPGKLAGVPFAVKNLFDLKGVVTLAARAAAFIITAAEGGNLHSADLRSRARDFDPMTRDRFLAGALMPAPGSSRRSACAPGTASRRWRCSATSISCWRRPRRARRR